MPIGDLNSTALGSAARFNDGKPPLDLIPANIIGEHVSRHPVGATEPSMSMLLRTLGQWQFREGDDPKLLHEALFWSGATWEDIARVFDYGRKKYAAWNWAKGMAWSVPTGCIMRHALAVVRGEIEDPESRQPHAGHIGCNLIMLLHYVERYQEGDDRPPRPVRDSATSKMSDVLGASVHLKPWEVRLADAAKGVA